MTKAPLKFSLQDVKRYFDNKDLTKGASYKKEGRVFKLQTSPDGMTFSSQVRGNYENFYTVNLRIFYLNDTVTFKGNCTCPVAQKCKHMAATLLKVLEISEKLPPNSTFVQDLEVVEETLDYSLTNWLDKFSNPKTLEQDTAKKVIIYVISLPKYSHHAFNLKAYRTTILKNGSYSASSKRISLSTLSYSPPEEASETDIAILQLMLSQSTSSYGEAQLDVSPSLAPLLLTLLFKIRRCYFESAYYPPSYLREGEQKKASITWQSDKEGNLSPACVVDNDGYFPILKLLPLHYVCTKTFTVGPLVFSLPEEQALALLNAPRVSPQQVEAFSSKLQSILGPGNQEFLPKIPKFETLNVLPIPHLKLKQVKLNNWVQSRDRSFCVAILSFTYQGKKVDFFDSKNDLRNAKNGDVTLLPRNFEKEQEYYNVLEELGFIPIKGDLSTRYNLSPKEGYLAFAEQFNKSTSKTIESRWQAFLTKETPDLEKQGWKISLDKNFPYSVIVEPQDDWYASIEQPDGNSWFDVELGVTVGNERLNLVPILLSLLKTDEDILENLEKLSKDDTFMVPLKGGKKLALKAARVYVLLKTLKQLFSYQRSLSAKEELRLEALEAALLAEMEEATKSLNLRWFGNTHVLELGKKLQGFTKLKTIKPAKEFKATLRPYQQDGLNWLQFLKEHKLAGILADDMGLGKTVQVLSHIAKEKEQKALNNPFLVIAPTSLMLNWKSEAARFAPTLKVLVLHGSKRKKDFENLQEYDLVLTTYPLLIRDKENLLKYSYHTVILDEAQTIKNARAKMTQIAYQLKAMHRLCMTGTPLENHLGELWSLFNFLMPGYLGKDKQFTQLFRTPIEKEGDNDKSKALARRIKPFVLRRTKQEVATELPPKTEILHQIELDGPQRDLYETIRVSMHEKVREQIAQNGAEKSHIVILDALLKLRQVCCDPSLLKINPLKEKATSAKLEELISMLNEMVDEGRKILLFSQFTSMLAIIEERLKKDGISYVVLTGQTKDRETPIKAFQEGDIPVFLISLKAGGTGLNLTAADTVIHYDPWWNPAVENQATDRAYRIGQDKPVFVYRLITKGTVEEKIIAMQEKKAKLMGSLFDPTAKTSSKLSAQDIQALFEPLE